MEHVSVANLGRLGDVRVAVGRQPLMSMLSLVADVLGAKAQGVPPPWRQAVRRACPPVAVQALRPAFAPGALWVPDCLSPAPLDGGGPGAQLERMRETRPEALYADLTAAHPHGVPPRWQCAMDEPRRFTAQYVTLMTSVWRMFAPIWKRSQELLDRETERIGTAAVTGALGPLLETLSPRVTFIDDALRPADPCAQAVELRDRDVALIPLVSGSTASVINFDLEDSLWIGYPLPGLRELWGTRPPGGTAHDPLEAILGAMRARLLRLAHRALTMGDVSTLLNCGPSAVTHHCKQLEQAGLVRRERHGQHVRLLRTTRGEQLLSVLTD